MMFRKLLILAAASSAMSAFAAEPAAKPAAPPKPLSHELTRAEFEQLLTRPNELLIVDLRRPDELARSGRAADLLTAKGFKVAGLLGAQTYEEQGGRLTKIEVPPPRNPAAAAAA